MLSVSCFIGMFGGAHGFVRACAKRSTRGQPRMQAGSTGGGPHVAFFLGSVVGGRHTDARLGLGTNVSHPVLRTKPDIHYM
jgi:hypothetical protein